MKYSVLKPAFDLTLGLILSILSLPLFIFLTLVLTIYRRGNPFYIHARVGKHEERINVLKFRTSSDSPGHDGTMITDQYKKRKLECFLRLTSIDHLPEIFYVLSGKMSLVGPRPLLIEYLPRYSKEQYRRHEVKPGLTGWAQVNGGNALSWQERFNYDVWYVDNMSFSLDIKILFLTVIKVIKGEGINQPGHTSSEKFTGNYQELTYDKEKPFKTVWKSNLKEDVKKAGA